MKLNKIKVALFAAGVFFTLPAFALTGVVDDPSAPGLLGTANNSYSTAIGQDAVAGSGLSYGQTVLEVKVNNIVTVPAEYDDTIH